MADVFTARDKQRCAEREAGKRRRVYPRLVEHRGMKQAEADREIAMMDAIAVDYKALAEAEDAKGKLL